MNARPDRCAASAADAPVRLSPRGGKPVMAAPRRNPRAELERVGFVEAADITRSDGTISATARQEGDAKRVRPAIDARTGEVRAVRQRCPDH